MSQIESPLVPCFLMIHPRTHRLIPIPVAFAILLLGAAASAQEPTDPQESGLVEEVKVRLVTLTIYAIDDVGLPVTDLEPEELVVHDGGDEVPVAFLDAREPLGDAEVTARLYVDAPGGATRPVSTFRGQPLFYVFLLDLVHEPMIDQEEAKRQLQEFVKYQFDGDELVALLSFTGSINLELPFTNDAGALGKAVDAAYARKRVPADDVVMRVRRLLTKLDMCRRGEDDEGVWICINQVATSYLDEGRNIELQFISVLEGAVDFTAGLSGRKSLVVLGQGASINPELELNAAISSVMLTNYTGIREMDDYEFNLLVNKAIERGVVVHFIARSRHGPKNLTGAQYEFGANEIGGDPLRLAQEGAEEAMAIVAKDTGGVLIKDKDLTTGLQEVIELERSGYTLGYYLDEDPNRRKRQTLRKVKVSSRRKGVTIIAPKRYSVAAPLEQDIDVKLAVQQPLPGTEEGMWQIPFQIQADPQQIGYEVKKGVATANFIIETSVLQADGRVVVRAFNFINHEYDRKEWKSGKTGPLAIDAWVELPTGDYEIKAVVSNYKAEHHGEATRRFKLAF
ncbi:MAG: VWA domain-containing protein [Acidobacteriota bacterium]|nr:VWA domain-containing protein [Acidobacteriota bacterium]